MLLKERTSGAAALETYADVHGKLDKLINQADHEAFDLAMACVLANGRDGDAVAMFLVAAPSTGKTEYVNAMKSIKWTHEQSDLTTKTFMSGYRTEKAQKPSLLDRLSVLEKTCLLNKEFTTVLKKRSSDKDEILSQLREILDGSLNKDFGTGESIKWKGRLGILAAVTPAIDQHGAWSAQSNLGDRWLFVRVRSGKTTEDRLAMGRAALKGNTDVQDRRQVLREATKRHLESLQNEPTPLIPPVSEEFLLEMAELTARGRATIPRDTEGRHVVGEPIVEGNPRLARIFGRLAEAIALVRGHKSVEPEDLQAIRRVAEDTVKQERLKVYRCLLSGYRTVQEVAEESGLSNTMTTRTLEDMDLLKLVVKIPEKTGSPGRPSNLRALLPLT